jgi:hypothetical protein
MMVVSRIKYYKNISTPRHPAWFLYYRSTVFPTQTFRDLLVILQKALQVAYKVLGTGKTAPGQKATVQHAEE